MQVTHLGPNMIQITPGKYMIPTVREGHKYKVGEQPLNYTIYSKPACVQCSATYRAFDRLGADYNIVDLTEDGAARELVTDELGYMQAPVVIVRRGEEIVSHWSGFRPDKITEYA